MDIIGRLPIEVSQLIFVLLEAEDLGRCCMVSKRWRSIANYDKIWYKLCKENGLDLDEPSEDEYSNEDVGLAPLCKWASKFTTYVTSVANNWKKNICKKYYIPFTSSHYVPHLGTDGNIVALGDGSGTIDVWKLKGEPSRLQTLHIPCRGHVTNVVTNSSFIVAVVDSCFLLVYELGTEGYQFLIGLGVKQGIGEERFIFKRDEENVGRFIKASYPGAMFLHNVGIFDNVLHIRTSLYKVFLWRLNSPFDFVGEISLYADVCAVTSYKHDLYIQYSRRIVAYNKDCVEMMVFEIDDFSKDHQHRYVSSLHCNSSLITAISGNCKDLKDLGRKLVVWDKHSSLEIAKKPLLKFEFTFLHPRLDIVFIVHQMTGPQYVVRAWNPKEDNVLWMASHVCDSLDSFYFGIVGWKYFLCFSSLHSDYPVFNTKTGEKVRLKVNDPCQATVLYCNDSIILAESRFHKHLKVVTFSDSQ